VKKIKEIKEKYFNKLRQSIDNQNEIDAVFHRLLFHFYNISRLDFFLNPEKEIDEKAIVDALDSLKKGIPWQYIAGEIDFCDLRLKVNKNVLIPRPETEELIRWIIDDYRELPPKKILDIGTGSGVIAIALAKHFKQSEVTAIDNSKEALDMAKENAQINQVEIDFVLKDILQTKEMTTGYDIIVSNPPYVRESEKKYMKKNVLDYEPVQALFVPDGDPLIYYKKIIDLFTQNIKAGGKLYFEINEFMKEELTGFLLSKGFKNFEFRKDIFDKWRMLRIAK